MEAMVRRHMRFATELRAAGKMVVGERLRPDGDATRVPVKAGQRQLMDGPFTETKEALGGFYLMRHQGGGARVGQEDSPRRARVHRGAPDLADVTRGHLSRRERAG